MTTLAVLSAIEKHAAELSLPAGVEAGPLLRAFAWVESSGGVNAVARHEDGFCPNQHGGNVNQVVRGRHSQWGCLSCCSYGPWQVLYHTAADMGFVGMPTLLSDPAVNVVWAVALLNRIVKRGADSVAKIADAYNSGTHRDANVPAAYIAKLTERYSALKGT